MAIMNSLLAHYIACCDLYNLQFAYCPHSQSPANSTVNSECKILSTGMASESEGAQTLEQFSWCEKPNLCSAGESSQETGVKQFPDHETSATWLLVEVESSCQMAPECH